MTNKTLFELYTDINISSGDGIFYYLSLRNYFTWLTSANCGIYDDDYFMFHAGTRKLSYTAQRLFTEENNAKWVYLMNTITNIIINRYGEKWNKIYNSLIEEYNPLDNYNMEEERTPNIVREHTANDTENANGTATQTNNVYAFNATTPQPNASADGTSNTTSSIIENHVEKEMGNEKLTRRGNIGVTTSQQMLQSEIDLRIKNKMYAIIFTDVDTLLTANIF